MNGLQRGFMDNGDVLSTEAGFDDDPYGMRPRPDDIPCAEPEWSVCLGPDEPGGEFARSSCE